MIKVKDAIEPINTPIDFNIVRKHIKESNIANIGKATIREIVKLVNDIQQESGSEFIRMEMGVPGIEPHQIGIEGEIKALRSGVASKYANIEGIAPLKNEISRFVKLFMNIDVKPQSCLPTVGSMQGSFATFFLTTRLDPQKDTILFIDPGFPVQKQQVKILGIKYETFDVYNYRGDKLYDKIESYLKKGNITAIMYSNPNNPSWICFTEKELEIIGTLATKYNTIVVEDLAYFAMDFRKDLSKPGVPPYQATVARYTDNFILLISSSKSFSYAGQRIGMLIVSDLLMNNRYDYLKNFYPTDQFAHSLIYGTLYALTAGASHSAQYALYEMLKAANDGSFNFVEHIKEYAIHAQVTKKMFCSCGFNIVYDKDENEPIGDGFYYTVSYPGFTGEELVEELLYYGISAIALTTTGSQREGIRACVSQIYSRLFPVLEERLKLFHQHHTQ